MALRAFDAASRTSSFKKAAEELLLTPSAVSRHIRNLEVDLGRPLFHRHGRDVVLTEDGQHLKTIVHAAFDQLVAGIGELRARNATPSLTVSLLPSLAARWLAQRIDTFGAQYPDLELRIHCARALVDMNGEGVDIAIRYGLGNWPGCRSELLMHEQIVVVCSPSVGSRLGRRPKPADLVKQRLLHSDNPQGWHEWFDAAGCGNISIPQGPLFTDDNALLQAAVDGQGIALGRSVLIAEDIARGRLIAPMDVSLDAAYAYWLVTAQGHPLSKAANDFRKFLASELEGNPR